MSGPFALDYNVFLSVMERKGIQGEAFDKMMDDLALIEVQALHNINKK